jgi:hypothetical protein
MSCVIVKKTGCMRRVTCDMVILHLMDTCSYSSAPSEPSVALAQATRWIGFSGYAVRLATRKAGTHRRMLNRLR